HLTDAQPAGGSPGRERSTTDGSASGDGGGPAYTQRSGVGTRRACRFPSATRRGDGRKGRPSRGVARTQGLKLHMRVVVGRTPPPARSCTRSASQAVTTRGRFGATTAPSGSSSPVSSKRTTPLQ